MAYRGVGQDDQLEVDCPSVLFVCFGKLSGSKEDGGDIYDRKTLAALRRHGLNVEAVEVERQRHVGLPMWATPVPPAVRARIASAHHKGRQIICSHEALFSAVKNIPTSVLIVHNYFPAFSFPGQRLLEGYYRTGARRHFSEYFCGAGSVVFLSARDYRHAVEDFPGIASKAQILPPPPFAAPLLERRLDLVHVSGSEDWLPKRLSRLSASERAAIHDHGLVICDFGSEINPAFGLINDRFVVGFKLKLMQMIYSRDVIASLSDVSEDLHSVADNYPFFQQVGSISEALDYFGIITRGYSAKEIELRFESTHSNWKTFSWDHMALRLARLLRQMI